MVRVLDKEYGGKIHVRIYEAGKDTEYVKKYGAVTKACW